MRNVTGSERGSEESYYAIAHHLPRETADYVPLMIAAARIAKDPGRYGFEHVVPLEPLLYEHAWRCAHLHHPPAVQEEQLVGVEDAIFAQLAGDNGLGLVLEQVGFAFAPDLPQVFPKLKMPGRPYLGLLASVVTFVLGNDINPGIVGHAATVRLAGHSREALRRPAEPPGSA